MAIEDTNVPSSPEAADSKPNVHESANRDVLVRSLDGFASWATVGGEHSLVIDEPKEFEGDGRAPNPFGLILSALGGCIVGTLAGVARQHSLPYESSEVTLRLKVNRPTYGPLDSGERELRISKIEAHVTIRGDLNGDQQEILRHAVETCPVGNTLRRALRLDEQVNSHGPSL